jgi:fumarylpyruvate hydrolase
MSTSYVIPAAPQPVIAVAGTSETFPVRRIWCVGRNYLEHIRELGNDEKQPPFFFSKHADMVEADGAIIPYPSMTKDFHFEAEFVIALKSGGANIDEAKALDHVYGYGVGIDFTRRDQQNEMKKLQRPWEIAKSFDRSAPISALAPAAKIGHPSKGRIWLSVNGTMKQDADLAQMIWDTPGIISKLSQQVNVAAGDIIMTGTPAGVAAVQPGDKLECGIDGIGTLKVSIGK